jgi:hypothetical protein
MIMSGRCTVLYNSTEHVLEKYYNTSSTSNLSSDAQSVCHEILNVVFKHSSVLFCNGVCTERQLATVFTS